MQYGTRIVLAAVSLPTAAARSLVGKTGWVCAGVVLMCATSAQGYVLFGTTWNSGNPATVTYAYLVGNVNTGEAGAGGTMTRLDGINGISQANWETQINLAFAAWAAVANVTFNEVIPDNGVDFNAGGTNADIRIGAHTMDGAGGTLAHAYYPPPNGVSAAGDVHFDSADAWKIGFGGGGFDIFQVAAHEIGHSIGLMHTAVPNSLMNASYTEAFSGPQADDIAGAADLFDGGGLGGTVPEPLTASLSLMGLSALGSILRRRERQHRRCGPQLTS